MSEWQMPAYFISRTTSLLPQALLVIFYFSKGPEAEMEAKEVH
jgi:hypothetical protein